MTIPIFGCSIPLQEYLLGSCYLLHNSWLKSTKQTIKSDISKKYNKNNQKQRTLLHTPPHLFFLKSITQEHTSPCISTFTTRTYTKQTIIYQPHHNTLIAITYFTPTKTTLSQIIINFICITKHTCHYLFYIITPYRETN